MPEPISFTDLKLKSTTITYNDQVITIRAVSFNMAFELLNRFPPLMGLAVQRGVSIQDLFSFGNEIISAIIACAVGMPGSKDAEAMAATLPMELQLNILEAMAECSFTSGFGPFVQRLRARIEALSEKDGRGPPTSGASLSRPSAVPPKTASGK